MDVMENIGREPTTIHGTVHGPHDNLDYSGTYSVAHGNISDDFHIYTLEWNPQHLYFFVDGINYYTFDRITLMRDGDWVYDHPFSIVLNLAVGGTWPKSPDSTTIFPQKMYISYIRVYQ